MARAFTLALALCAASACKKKEEPAGKGGATAAGPASGAPQLPPPPAAPPMMALPTVDGGPPREVIADPFELCKPALFDEFFQILIEAKQRPCRVAVSANAKGVFSFKL